MSEFFQEAPGLANQYDDDRLLRVLLEWRLPGELHAALWCARDLAPLERAAATRPRVSGR